MNRMSPIPHPSMKKQNASSMRVANPLQMGAGGNLRHNRALDDQSINNRLRQLQDQKREIANLALKYDL